MRFKMKTTIFLQTVKKKKGKIITWRLPETSPSKEAEWTTEPEKTGTVRKTRHTQTQTADLQSAGHTTVYTEETAEK